MRLAAIALASLLLILALPGFSSAVQAAPVGLRIESGCLPAARQPACSGFEQAASATMARAGETDAAEEDRAEAIVPCAAAVIPPPLPSLAAESSVPGMSVPRPDVLLRPPKSLPA